MYVACSTLCFSKLSLEDALHTIREMHFTKADLAVHAAGTHLTLPEVLADPGGIAQRLRAANLPLAAIHVDPAGMSSPEERSALRAVARLARVLTAPLLTIPAAAAGSDFDAETARLKDLVRLATSEGVILTIETLATAVTADPQGAAELCRRVPGLGLTLDPTHYLTGPHGAANYDLLFPFIRHVRLRDSGSKPDQLQVRIGQGEIEYGRIIGQLERCGYDRALSVDVQDHPESPFPVEPEVRKLKYLLESLV